MTTRKPRPNSIADDLQDNHNHTINSNSPNNNSNPDDDNDPRKKEKKKWTMKLFKTNEIMEPSKGKTLSDSKLTTRGKVQGLFRNNSAEVLQLQDKINELETQLETYKHSRFQALDKKHSLHAHQKMSLDSSNWKDFRFKGAVFVKNKQGEDIESLEVIPDLVEFMMSGSEAWLKQAILNVDLMIAPKQGLDIFIPKTISIFYYLQHKSEMRFDYLFNISLNYKAVLTEMNDFVENREKTAGADSIFEITDFCNGHEIKTKIQVVSNSEGKFIPVLKEFVIQIPMGTSKHNYPEVADPIFTTKTIQNYWFNLEIVKKGDEASCLGPFSPSEQQLHMEDSHYFVEQEIPISAVAVLGTPKNSEKRIEKCNPHDLILVFNYYVRDKSHEDSALFCICSVEVSQAEIVKCSQGNQRVGDRFRMEKQLGLGMVRVTFHFFVGEEMIPEPVLTGQALNPLCGYWILERVSIAIRV